MHMLALRLCRRRKQIGIRSIHAGGTMLLTRILLASLPRIRPPRPVQQSRAFTSRRRALESLAPSALVSLTMVIVVCWLLVLGGCVVGCWTWTLDCVRTSEAVSFVARLAFCSCASCLSCLALRFSVRLFLSIGLTTPRCVRRPPSASRARSSPLSLAARSSRSSVASRPASPQPKRSLPEVERHGQCRHFRRRRVRERGGEVIRHRGRGIRLSDTP